MRIILVLVLSVLILQGCNSQSNFDLSKVVLNKDKISDIILPELKSATYDIGVSAGDYKYTSTGSDKILMFNQVNFSGENPKANYENKAAFFFNIQDSIITRYQLETAITKQSIKLLEILNVNLGNPNFTGFSTENDKTDDIPSKFIWEDLEKNTLHHLSYSKQHYGIHATLNVLPVSKIYPALPGITYWENFISQREKRKDPNYNYQQYLQDELENNPDNIQNKLSR